MSLWTPNGYSELNVLLRCNVYKLYMFSRSLKTPNEHLHETFQ